MGTDSQIRGLVESLTRAQKLSLVRGITPPSSSSAVTGYLPAVEAHGIPELRLTDGPLGIRSGAATAFPAAIALGASFDPALAREFGRAVGREARAKGFDVVLAPGCNLLRVPQCGRSFEYYSEDPYLTSRLTVGTVRGIQSQDVVATPKHYVANNQEDGRCTASAAVSERALRELYLPAFEAAVREGDAGAVMSAYNRIDGTFASEHERLLRSVLKEEFGLDGPVMSDWWAVQDGLAAARAGLDLEMPGVNLLQMVAMTVPRLGGLGRIAERWPDDLADPDDLLSWLIARGDPHDGIPVPRDSQFAADLPDALAGGALPRARLDEMVARVLRMHERVGALDGSRVSVDVDRERQRSLAARVATRGTVLLCNDGVLPLDGEESVAVFGPSVDRAKLGGGGSSEVDAERTVTPLAALRARADGRVVAGEAHPEIAEAGMFDAILPSLGGETEALDVAAVEAAAARADVAVVVVEDTVTEGRDRESLSLPGEQDRLVAAVAEAATETVVVLQTAGPVETPWLDAVDAVLEAWYPGQEAGRAIASVLYGDADAGGRLPVTFAPEGAYPASSRANYPGVETVEGYPKVRYDEGVFVGYRHFDERGLDPTFPFGHGHSYATTEYEGLEVSTAGDDQRATVSVTVTNTADRPGRAVPQVYCRPDNPPVSRPPRELVGARSLALGAGESQRIEVTLDDRAFAYYDEPDGEWTVGSEVFEIEVGRSSRDARASAVVSLDCVE